VDVGLRDGRRIEHAGGAADEDERNDADDDTEDDPFLADAARRTSTAPSGAPPFLAPLLLAPLAARAGGHLCIKDTHLDWSL
ncbi:MAG: hypothetical protein AAB295_12835, partial [Chloroflexota bacterium]